MVASKKETPEIYRNEKENALLKPKISLKESIPLFFSEEKVIKNVMLNFLGLQVIRYCIAKLLYSTRGITNSANLKKSENINFLKKNGFLIIKNYLPEEEFTEFKKDFDPLKFEHKIDNISDGGTFVERKTINYENFTRHGMISNSSFINEELLDTIKGAENRKEIQIDYFWLDTIRLGESKSCQNDLHTDTFYDTHKIWYFPEAVNKDNGPLIFYPMSHKFSISRMIFEWINSVKYLEANSFSWRNKDVSEFKLVSEEQSVVVPENTLVIANTHGFHRRSEGKTGEVRNQIHFCARSNPFEN